MNVVTPVMANATESEKLGRFALDLDLANVPGEVLTLAREHLLDAFGISPRRASISASRFCAALRR
ncbi:MAG: hypothetical protein J0J01_13955 [Reyranella sp.]|uniref:hypothetical protein n=1 Tax=Reyranella sp. TaxID=1929291 RepID=UPI001AC28801|nr:hypothetical protein [Reyranella sp.]MBN9088010.1 hypothetical protein [Reyranella sp.]